MQNNHPSNAIRFLSLSSSQEIPKTSSLQSNAEIHCASSGEIKYPEVGVIHEAVSAH